MPALSDAGMGAPRMAIFLDQDGGLIDKLSCHGDPARIMLAPGAAAGLRLLASLGYELIVAGNQPGLALGQVQSAALHAVQRRIDRLLDLHGVALAGVHICPHHPAGKVAAYTRQCDCRKPQPGLLVRAASEHGIDLSRSWTIGDTLDDVEAGRRAGCRTILIGHGHDSGWPGGPWRTPDHLARDLHAAALVVQARS